MEKVCVLCGFGYAEDDMVSLVVDGVLDEVCLKCYQDYRRECSFCGEEYASEEGICPSCGCGSEW